MCTNSDSCPYDGIPSELCRTDRIITIKKDLTGNGYISIQSPVEVFLLFRYLSQLRNLLLLSALHVQITSSVIFGIFIIRNNLQHNTLIIISFFFSLKNTQYFLVTVKIISQILYIRSFEIFFPVIWMDLLRIFKITKPLRQSA